VRPDVAGALKEGGRGVASGRSQRRARSALVVAQVGLSLLLLVGASLLGATFLRLRAQPLGFEPAGVLIGGVSLPPAQYPLEGDQARFWQRLVERLEQTPGVTAAALAGGLPLTDADARAPYAVDAAGAPPLEDRPLGLMRSVTPGYFATLGVRRLAGRDFALSDDADSPGVAILSQATARRLFPGRSAVGGRLLVGSRGGGIPVEVVGVVADVRSVEIGRENDVEIYRPYGQRILPFAQLAVRVAGSELLAVPRVEEALRTLDPELPLAQPQPMPEVVRAALDPQRLAMSLCAAFAGMALVLSLVGVYSVVAYDVRQRTAEIGIRLMLGASRRSVERLLLTGGMRPVLLGAALGTVGALGVGRLLSRQLFGVSATDPWTLGGALLALLAAAALACYLPARRSSASDGAALLRRG
jgi:predicted permease